VIPRESLRTYRALLADNRNYRLWFGSSLGAAIGDWIGIFALQVLIISLTPPGSRLALFGLGGLMMARVLPSIVLGPFTGVLADRYDRKHLMVAAQLARGVLFIGIAAYRNLVFLFAMIILIEILSLLFMASKDSSLPTLVPHEQITHANQMNLLVTYAPMPFGAGAAAALAAIAALLEDVGLPAIDPIVLALSFNAATFLVAGAIIARVELPPHGRAAAGDGVDDVKQDVLGELREMASFIHARPLIRGFIVGVLGVFFGAGVVVTLGPEFVRTVLDRPGTDWFRLMTVFGVGLLFGMLATPFFENRVRIETLFPVAIGTVSLVGVAIALLPRFDLALASVSVMGIAAGVSFVAGYTLLHRHVEDRLRGRTFAAFYAVTRISMFTALAIAPFVAGFVGEETITLAGRDFRVSGIRITLFLGGIVALGSALFAAREARAS
jgi:dTMP kinase